MGDPVLTLEQGFPPDIADAALRMLGPGADKTNLVECCNGLLDSSRRKTDGPFVEVKGCVTPPVLY